MYRISPLPRKVLITSDEVIALAAIEENPGSRILIAAIQIAEERFIRPALGNELYYAFRDKKNVVVTDVNKATLEAMINDSEELAEPVVLNVGEILNAAEFMDDDWMKQLWNEHLWKLCAEAVVYIATPTNFSRFTAQGEMQNNPKTLAAMGDGKGAASADLPDIKWKMDKLMMDRIDPLISAMNEWICENITHFTNYDKKRCAGCGCSDNVNTSTNNNSSGVSYQRKSAWVHDIYDNIDKRRGNRVSSHDD
jgi:hypothetical protein